MVWTVSLDGRHSPLKACVNIIVYRLLVLGNTVHQFMLQGHEAGFTSEFFVDTYTRLSFAQNSLLVVIAYALYRLLGTTHSLGGTVFRTVLLGCCHFILNFSSGGCLVYLGLLLHFVQALLGLAILFGAGVMVVLVAYWLRSMLRSPKFDTSAISLCVPSAQAFTNSKNGHLVKPPTATYMSISPKALRYSTTSLQLVKSSGSPKCGKDSESSHENHGQRCGRSAEDCEHDLLLAKDLEEMESECIEKYRAAWLQERCQNEDKDKKMAKLKKDRAEEAEQHEQVVEGLQERIRNLETANAIAQDQIQDLDGQVGERGRKLCKDLRAEVTAKTEQLDIAEKKAQAKFEEQQKRMDEMQVAYDSRSNARNEVIDDLQRQRGKDGDRFKTMQRNYERRLAIANNETRDLILTKKQLRDCQRQLTEARAEKSFAEKRIYDAEERRGICYARAVNAESELRELKKKERGY